MTPKELDEEFRKAKLELLKLRLGLASHQIKETAKVKKLRRYIARIKTLERQLAIEKLPAQSNNLAKSVITK